MRKISLCFGAVCCLLSPAVFGQIDPDRRELVQVGGQQAIQGASPLTGYGFYYLNEPNFFATNVTLRLAAAPVYIDSETGFVGLLGPNTDLGLGFAGGLFGDNYYEYENGKYLPQQSFYGHDVEGSVSVYHTFNPGQKIPVFGVLRLREHYSVYSGDNTDPRFALPNDHSTTAWRAGIRAGGREPVLRPDLAGELSVWYEGQHRTDSGTYGYDGERNLNSDSQMFWARALLIYTMDNKQTLDFNVTGGSSIDADRFSAYRLGGNLPLISEFPLSIPGYFYQELSARSFVCFNAQYFIPIDPAKQWTICPMGSIAGMDYLPGTEQGDGFNSGVGLGVGYRSHNGVWQALASYGYGFEAIRSTGHGGQSIGIMVQYDLEAKHPGGPSKVDELINFMRDHL